MKFRNIALILALLIVCIIPITTIGKNETGSSISPNNSNNPTSPISPIILSTVEELKEEFAKVPCDNKDRLKNVRALFEKNGVDPALIRIENYNNTDNLVAVKPGKTDEKIVIGAHYDKVKNGCGAIDNWTGIVTLAHLYKSIKDYPTNKTLIFVAFGKEEAGKIGSRGMADAIKKEQLDQYCAMINIDSLGMGAPQVADNMSSKKFEQLTEELAEQLKIPFGHSIIPNADSDSSSFLKRKIPAITIHGLANNWISVLHSENDQAAKVDPNSVYLGYRLALLMIKNVDEAQCGSLK
jgi:Iap family predicted aminopeptidase